MPFIVAVSGKKPESYNFALSLAEYLRAHGGCRNSAVCPTSEGCLNRTARVEVLSGASSVEKAREIIAAGRAEYVLTADADAGADVDAVVFPDEDVPSAGERLLEKLI